MKRIPTQQVTIVSLILWFSLTLPGCGGGLSSLRIPLGPPPCPACPTELLFATGINQILEFQVDPSTGALSAPTIISGPNQSLGLLATPTKLYVSDFANDGVNVFSIADSGALTVVAGSPFSLGGTPPGAGGLVFDNSGGFLYATDLNAGAVVAWSSNQGRLTPIPGSPFSAGNTPVQVVVDSQNKFLYVSNLNDSAGGVSAFTINFNTGVLSPIPGSPFATGPAGSFPGPSAIVNAQGTGTSQFLYVAMAGTANANNKIVAFAIDPNTGGLSAVPGSPFTTGKGPLYMTRDATGTFLYTADVQDGAISGFRIDTNTGTLSPIPGSPFAGGTSVAGIAAADQFLYVADPQADAIRGYTVDNTSSSSTGALTPFTTPPFAAGNGPTLLSETHI